MPIYSASSSGGSSSGAGSHTEIETVDLSVAATNIEFSAIPSTFRDLLVVGRVRSDRANVEDDLELRVGNGTVDAGTNYAYVTTIAGSASANKVGNGVAQATIANISAASATASRFTIVRLYIYDYADTDEQRMWENHAAANFDGATFRVSDGGGHWTNTSAAIDVVRFYPKTGTNLVAGSKLTLYGIG